MSRTLSEIHRNKNGEMLRMIDFTEGEMKASGSRSVDDGSGGGMGKSLQM
jgi:hypothetical protein